MKKRSVVVSAFTLEARLKRRIREHLRKLGFERGPGGALAPPSSSKESIRALHFEQRRDFARKRQAVISENAELQEEHEQMQERIRMRDAEISRLQEQLIQRHSTQTTPSSLSSATSASVWDELVLKGQLTN